MPCHNGRSSKAPITPSLGGMLLVSPRRHAPRTPPEAMPHRPEVCPSGPLSGPPLSSDPPTFCSGTSCCTMLSFRSPDWVMALVPGRRSVRTDCRQGWGGRSHRAQVSEDRLQVGVGCGRGGSVLVSVCERL